MNDDGATPSDRVYRQELPFEPSIAGVARAAVRNPAMGIDDPYLLDVEVVVSELATNAFLHGRPPVSLVVIVDASRARIEVSDGAPHMPRRVAPSAARGVGLHVVAALTSAWGALTHPHGKTVWAEVRLGSTLNSEGIEG